MKASNIISYLLTGLAVKAYMTVAILWSKSNELYSTLQQSTIKGSPSTSVFASPKA